MDEYPDRDGQVEGLVFGTVVEDTTT